MSEPTPLASLFADLPDIGVLQDATYRPFAEYICGAVTELPSDLALDAIVKMLREFHALPLDVEPRLLNWPPPYPHHEARDGERSQEGA